VLAPVLTAALRNPYFQLKPPRTAGREQFGREYTAKFIAACQRHSKKPEDALATATALTAETIALSYKQFVLAKMKAGQSGVDYIVSGGGARNHTLMAMLAQRLEPRPLLCWRGKPGITCRAMCPRQPALRALQFWAR
jgi:anhydro-N-acetylmuramic acid kinase